LTRRFTGVFEERKCGGSLHCGFASGRDDGGGGWGGEQTTARAKAKCGGPSTAASPPVGMTEGVGGCGREQTTARAKAKCGAPPLRFAPVGMTEGVGGEENRQRQEQRRNAGVPPLRASRSGRYDGGGGWVRKRTDNGKDCWFGLCSSHPSRETKARWMGHPAPDSVEQSKINMTRGLDTVHLLV